ncbi:Protein of unknown function [Gryllus bimaculatus]|nr:Protein of unknown function [Gryllus bimaculatus]
MGTEMEVEVEGGPSGIGGFGIVAASTLKGVEGPASLAPATSVPSLPPPNVRTRNLLASEPVAKCDITSIVLVNPGSGIRVNNLAIQIHYRAKDTSPELSGWQYRWQYLADGT